MGQYSTKNDEKIIEEKENDYLKYISYNIQGWKKQNENTFISELSQKDRNNYDIFCLFDGHNGNEVSQFLKNHFYNEFLNNIKLNPSNIKDAIEKTFIQMNTLMKTEKGKEEIIKLRKENIKKENKKYKKILNRNESIIEELSKEEEEEILDYTGCTACLIVIDEKNKKLFFGNIGNSEVLILGKNDPIILSSKHRPTDKEEIDRINAGKEQEIIFNDKVFGILNVKRAFGDFAFIKKNDFEPHITDYNIKDDDKFIFMGTESVIECIDKEKIGEIMSNNVNRNKGSLKITIEQFFENNISYDFYDNDTEYGFDNMTCTLIQLKNNND